MALANSSELDPTLRALMVPQVLSGAQLPIGLSDLLDPPEALFLTGFLPPGPYVGIVGTRKPSAKARNYATSLATELARRGVTVVSGGALGIDAAAHLGALRSGSPTLVIAPSSYEHPYPPEHARLFARVARQGGFLSEHATGVKAQPHQFFRRNALLVALVQALVIVEAPLRSGARNAGLWARKLNRPLYVVPSAPWNSRGRGCLEELRLGARLLTSHKDVVDELERHSGSLMRARAVLGSSRASTPEQRSLFTSAKSEGEGSVQSTAKHTSSAPAHATGVSRAIVGALARGPLHAEQLAASLEEPLPLLQRALLDLELCQAVERDGSGRYSLTTTKGRAT